MRALKSITVLFLLVLAAACSDGNTNDNDGDATCGTMCTDADFSDGEESQFQGGVVECLCSGNGLGLLQEDCNAYCANFGVSPANSFVTSEVATNDKCVCDGTAE